MCGVCSITVEQDCAACICVGVLKTAVNGNADSDMAHKIQSGRLFVKEKRIWTAKNIKRVVQVRKDILQKPKKSVGRTTLETQIPPTTARRILRKRLIMKPYKLLLVQAIAAEDKRKRKPN